MIRLVPVQKEERNLLWNINQKYLYEMTLYYPDPMDEEGNYHYGHFEEYFTDPQRKAFFLFDNGVRVGFAMVHPYSVLEHSPDYTMAEFAIFPTFRRKGYAEDAARLIFSRYPGNWEIKYNEKNVAAKSLWQKVTAPYNPTLYHLNKDETVLEFSVYNSVLE